MSHPTPADLAKEIDRLVIGVHRAVMVNYGAAIRAQVDPLQLESPGHLMDLAEFLLANACTPELARNRFPYDGPDLATRLFTQLKEMALLDGEGQASDDLADLLRQVLAARAQVSASLWPDSLTIALEGASKALAAASSNVVDAFRLLPEPSEPAHRLHHLLTGLRYARLDAHVLAWQSVGLGENSTDAKPDVRVCGER